MADQDELRLKLVLDTEAFDEWIKKQANTPSEINVTPKTPKAPGGTKSENDALKERMNLLRAEIDLQDISLRKALTASQRREQAIRQEASLGKITQQQMLTGIAQEEAARENATAQAIANFGKMENALSQYDQTQQVVINRQKQLFFATERAQNGFTTMSGSMTALTSNTKDANIAFANFGRIVQDAPFGLLGLSNNIDPLLVSFAALKASSGGTGLALRALGAQLFGPAGLIFLLGSALPTALLFAQKAMNGMKEETKEASKEIDTFAESIKSAANSQTDALITSLSYTDQVRVLSDALATIRSRIHDQTVATDRQIKTEQEQARAFVESGRLTQEQADRIIASRKVELGITVEQDKAVRDSISTKLEDARANLLVEQSIKTLGVSRRQNADAIRAERQEQEDFDFYMARRGATQMIDGDTPLIRVAREQGEAFRKLQAEQAEEAVTNATRVGEGEIEVTRRGILARTQLYKEGEQVIADTLSTGSKLRLMLLENEQQGLIEMMDMTTLIARNAFGDTKAVAVAEALVNTYVGVTRALRKYDPPLSGIMAGLQLANGLATVNRIKNTKIGDNSVSRSRSTTSTATVAPAFDNVRTTSGTSAMFVASSTSNPNMYQPNLNINANVDRQGLAIAVREGEAEIRSQQIAFS